MPHLKTRSGIDWHYEVEGEGDVILFMHGWGVDKRIWRQQSKYFAVNHKVLTADLPGHGESSFIKIKLEDMVHDMMDIINHLHIHKFTLVGSSLGGLVGLKLYHMYPDKFRRIIFVGSMPKFAKSHDYPYGLDVVQMRKLNSQLNTAYPSIIDIFFRSLFTKEERESRRFKWLQKFRQTDGAPIKQALAEYLDVLENEDLREVLKIVHVPLLFVNGTHDPICDMNTMTYIKGLSPQAEFNFFEQCGHFPFLSKPHEFNQVLENFIKQTNHS
jgi:pimeloyl-ACP methyl ester esterase